MSDFSPQIVEHFSNPRNVGEMEDPDVTAFVGNPVCGDQIHLFARLADGRVTECTFLAYGCAASLATASILTESIRGQHLDEIAAIDEARVLELVGGLSPTQRHCATLAEDLVKSLIDNARTGQSGGGQGGCRPCQ
jgi:nitrogen fixation NifU-like protein